MIKARKIESKDYETIVGWWKAYNWSTIPPLESLPTDGIIVYKDDKPLAAGFLYVAQNAPWTFLTWMVTNRDFDRDSRMEGLKEVTKEGIAFSRSIDKKFIFTWNSQSGIIDTMVSVGFQKAEVNVMTLGYDITENDINFIKDDHLKTNI